MTQTTKKLVADAAVFKINIPFVIGTSYSSIYIRYDQTKSIYVGAQPFIETNFKEFLSEKNIVQIKKYWKREITVTVTIIKLSHFSHLSDKNYGFCTTPSVGRGIKKSIENFELIAVNNTG